MSVVAAVSCCSCRTAGFPEEDSSSAECMVSFEKSGYGEHFNVAVKDGYRADVWYVFRINHYLDHSSLQYMDLWRVDWAYVGRFDRSSREMSVMLDKILTDGENESVFKDYGENLNAQGKTHIDTYDFTGGYHGDERKDLEDGCGVEFLIDGKVLDSAVLESSFGWTDCSSFSYVQKSTMHKTALKVDGAPVESDHHIVALHTKTTSFSDGGYRTVNRLEMKDAIDFYWYFGICCISRNVAERGCSEDMKTVVMDAGGGNKLEAVGKRDYHAWSDANSIEAYVTSRLIEGGDDSAAKMHVWDNKNYAKYYRRYPASSAHRTYDGEVFSSEMTVKFMSR